MLQARWCGAGKEEAREELADPALPRESAFFSPGEATHLSYFALIKHCDQGNLKRVLGVYDSRGKRVRRGREARQTEQATESSHF